MQRLVGGGKVWMDVVWRGGWGRVGAKRRRRRMRRFDSVTHGKPPWESCIGNHPSQSKPKRSKCIHAWNWAGLGWAGLLVSRQQPRQRLILLLREQGRLRRIRHCHPRIPRSRQREAQPLLKLGALEVDRPRLGLCRSRHRLSSGQRSQHGHFDGAGRLTGGAVVAWQAGLCLGPSEDGDTTGAREFCEELSGAETGWSLR